jgi:hypothetical protein
MIKVNLLFRNKIVPFEKIGDPRVLENLDHSERFREQIRKT